MAADRGLSRQSQSVVTRRKPRIASRRRRRRGIIVSRREVVWTCPWLRVVKKTVRQYGSKGADDYYSILQQDYVNVLAITRDGLIPIVRQFRPAVEDFTWELPAGLRDTGETARAAAQRELAEETGFVALEMVCVGRHYIDTGRLCNRFYSFAAIAEAVRGKTREPGIEMRLIALEKLRRMILKGALSLQTHIALVYVAMTHPASVRMLDRHGLDDLRRRFLV